MAGTTGVFLTRFPSGLLGDGDLEQCPLAEGSTAPVDEDEEAVKCELPEEEALEMRDGVISAFDRDACSLTPGGSARAEEWLLGSSYDSDDYDTDLEEDFPPGGTQNNIFNRM